MQQKVLTYFYCLTGDEYVHAVEKDIAEQLKDGWHAISIGQSVFQTKKKNIEGRFLDFNELAISVLYERNDESVG